MIDSQTKRTWSSTSAFNDYIESLDNLEEDIENWMENSGITDYTYARRVTIDAEWEMWDMTVDLDGWIEDIAFEYEVDYDYLRTRANILLTEDVFRTLEFDETAKTLN